MRKFTLVIVTIAALVLFAVPVAAQDDPGPVNSITVTGTGSASGTPDQAFVEIGVERISTEVGTAFAETNTTLQAVIDAIVALGVAQEDIRTTGLNIYSQFRPGPEGPDDMVTEYNVSNRVRVVVRDIALVENVLSAAVEAGANQIFNLQFGFSDRGQIERDARSAAVDDARNAAEHLADLMGVTLGDPIIVTELSGGGFGPMMERADAGFGGAGGATVEPGQLSVSISVRVTFAIVR